jgi:glucan endo-1,3-alpha-glucosidase
MGDFPIDTREDTPFLQSDKAYMAAVSPAFFTHYGTSGEWAFNKFVSTLLRSFSVEGQADRS